MTNEPDDFEGIDISGPWGGVRIGAGGGRHGWRGRRDWDEDAEVRSVRRRVRHRIDFYKNVAFYLIFIAGLALIDGATGGGWWVQWVAGIMGAFLLLQFVTTFIAPALWGRDAEERMVQRELDRRRRRTGYAPPPTQDIPPSPQVQDE